MRIRGMLIALLLVGLAPFAACSEDDPVPKMPKTAAAAPTPSPTASPTPVSEAEQAEALIKEWAELDLEMQNTGETAAYLAITSHKCVSCRRLVDRVTKLYEVGGQVDLPGQRIVSVRHSPRIAGADVYEVKIDVLPNRVRKSASASWEDFAGGRTTNDFTVVRDGDELLIREIVTIS